MVAIVPYKLWFRSNYKHHNHSTPKPQRTSHVGGVILKSFDRPQTTVMMDRHKKAKTLHSLFGEEGESVHSL